MVTIDQVIAEKLNGWYINEEWPIGNLVLCVIALLLSIFLCGAIGYEREKRGRSAGLRTHLLVGVGSCIVMIISIYGFPSNSGNRDVARLAAQVITGIGFLGAGAIIHRNSGTRGLTTAATIWIVMAIGLACGSMNFILATVGTGLIILVLTFFRKVENRLNKKAPLIIIKAQQNTPIVSRLLEIADKYECMIDDLQVDKLDDNQIEITFLAVSKNNEMQISGFVAKLELIDGVQKVGIINNHKA